MSWTCPEVPHRPASCADRLLHAGEPLAGGWTVGVPSDVVVEEEANARLLGQRDAHDQGRAPQRLCVLLGKLGRGFAPVEVFVLVCALKLVQPRHWLMLRGLDEHERLWDTFSTLDATHPQLGEFAAVFNSMPIACILFNQVLCMSGG